MNVTVEEKVLAVELVFEKLDKEISDFQSWSNLHCAFGCGKCCFKADIEATVLEFLPFAYYLYLEKSTEAWLEKLTSTSSPVCLILNPHKGGQGLCSEYKHRGLICRLFGYSARNNKYGKPELVTCSVIKSELSEDFQRTSARISEGAKVPMMSHYYMQMHAIDPELTRDFYPINMAIKKAIETVLHYYAYR